MTTMELLERARGAKGAMALADTETKNRALLAMADALEARQADILAANAHYAQFEGKVKETAEKVNDTYLKTMQQSSGVQSYGEVVDYLIAWHLAGGK